MTDGPGGEALSGAVRALRYTIAVLGESDRQAAGGSPEDAAGVTMTVDEATALAPHLAHLVIATKLEMAAQLGASGHEEQAAAARGWLLAELEVHEMNASLAAIEAEVNGAAG